MPCILLLFGCYFSCQLFCDPMDCNLPESSVHTFSQARILEWVAISFTRASSWLKDGTHFLHWQEDSLPLSQQGSLPFINTLYILSLLNRRPDTIVGTDYMFLKMYKWYINCGTSILETKWYNLFSHFSWAWCCKNYSVISCIFGSHCRSPYIQYISIEPIQLN